MRCGHCHGEHATVEEVKRCSAGRSTPTKTLPSGEDICQRPAPRPTTPTVPTQTPAARDRGRVTDVLELVDLLNRFDPQATASTVRQWRSDPQLKRLIGFRRALVEQLATELSARGIAVTPRSLARAAADAERRVGRDASTLLQGRNDSKSTSHPSRPADGELHKRIGPTQRDPDE